MFDDKQIILERLRRQRLLNPIASSQDEEEYLALFKRLQPVSPVYNTRPGDPPRLVHRTMFHDSELSSELRAKHRYVKGKFLGGRVGYVLQEDLETYATVFRKKITKFKPIYEHILTVIRSSGGISKDQLKEELNYPAGEISKALQALLEAFIVYEDQTDTDWDTGWFDFATEWFDIQDDPQHYRQAFSNVIMNFLKAMVFASMDQIKSWSQLNRKTIQGVIDTLLHEGLVVQVEIPARGEGYILQEDLQALPSASQAIPKFVLMLDKSDFLVRAYLDELQLRYKGREVLQYLLIDGEFKGIVIGHWGFGSYDIEDIIVELAADEVEARKNEILDAVRTGYSPEVNPIVRYNGSLLV